MLTNKTKHFTLIIFSIFVLGFSFVQTLDYGLDKASPIAPYLNDQFQRSSPLWKVKQAYPNLQFEYSVRMDDMPGSNFFVVTQKEGMLWLVDKDKTTTEKKLFLDISAQVLNVDEAGLQDFAFHPEYGNPDSENKRTIFVNYNYLPPGLDNPNNYSLQRLSKFQVSDNHDFIDPDSEEILIQHFDRNPWHNGGE
jgi:hypothetical protein